jgi:putative MATE family efflux protein
MQPKHSLTEGSIPRALLLFALPILYGSVLQSLNGSVNAMWIGHYLGQAAFAAAGNANVVMFMLFGVIFGFSMATTVMVAQCVGARNMPEAKRVVGTSAAFFVALSLTLAAVGWIATPLLLRALHTPADALPSALAYLRIIFLAFPSICGLFFLMAVLRGAGDSKTPFKYLALSVGLDIVLNPLLIFGAGPVPRMGIAGSATATLIAQTISLAALIVHLYVTRNPLRILRDEISNFRPDWTVIRLLVSKGVPMGLHLFVVSTSMLALTALVNRYGSQETAAFNASMQLWNYVQMPAMAIGAAVSSMAGQNVGARRWDRVNRIALTGVAFNFVLGGALISTIYVLNAYALGLFLPSDGAAFAIALHLNRLVLWSFAFFGVSFVLFGVLRATGTVIAPLLMLIVSLWLIRLPFAYLLTERLQDDAIWWAFPVSSIISMLMAIAYFRYGDWRRDRMAISTAQNVPG